MTDEYSLPDEVIAQNRETIISLLRSTNREGIESLIEFFDGPESDFFTAPASSKFHMNVKGGLAQHVLNVRECLIMLNDRFPYFTEESVNLISILHDAEDGLLKYKEKYNKNKTRSAIPFEVNDILPLGHGEKSVMFLQRFIELKPQEMMSIRWHMGTYDYAMRQYDDKIKKTFPEVFLVFFADFMATLFIEDAAEREKIVETVQIPLLPENKND